MWKRKCNNEVFDITKKYVKTWWGGKKLVPTTKAEQKSLKRDLQRLYPNATIIDSLTKSKKELAWIDLLEEIDASLDDN